MSTNQLPHANNKLCKKTTLPRRDSDEIDVFEAARYFSDSAEGVGLSSRVAFHAAVKEERVASGRAEGRSLNVFLESMHPQQPERVEKPTKENKSKQPRSPGAKLASFLNSIFLTPASKKKAKSLKDEEGRKVRRFSTSHSQGIRSSESKHIHPSKSSGIRAPLPVLDAPTKGSRCGESKSDSAAWHDKRVTDEKKKAVGNEWLERDRRLQGVWSDVPLGNRWVMKGSNVGGYYWANDLKSKEKQSLGREEEDGSDCSSDLFELNNCGLSSDPSSGLPVYGTTDVKGIKGEGTAFC